MLKSVHAITCHTEKNSFEFRLSSLNIDINDCSCWCWLILPWVFAVGMPKQEQSSVANREVQPTSFLWQLPRDSSDMQWLSMTPRSLGAKAQGVNASRATMTSCVMVDVRATPFSDSQRSQRAHGRFCHVASALRVYLQWLSSTHMHFVVEHGWTMRRCGTPDVALPPPSTFARPNVALLLGAEAKVQKKAC